MPRSKHYERVMEALRHQEAAQSRFDYAVGPYVDAAALELTAADLRLSAAISETRSLFCPSELDKSCNRGKEC